MNDVSSRLTSPVLSTVKREELRSQTRRLRRKMLFESLEDRSLLATLYWDPNGTTAGVGGAGTWDLTSASWTTDSTGATGHVAWNNVNNDMAVFGGTAGTVTINPAALPTINVGGIDFAVTGYTVAAAATKSLTFAANSNVSVATGSTANISGEISGVSGFTKTNAGELVLGGTNTFAGLTTVNAGKLSVNGSTAAGSLITVNTGGRLGGTGTVNGTVTTAGTGAIDAGLAGSTAGTLLINSALTLGNTSTFAAQLGGTTPGDGAGFYDQVTAGNTVDLGGATLNVTLNGFLPAVSSQFTIIDKTSAGPILGNFNGLPEGQQFVAGGTTFQISYVGGTGNDVVLTTIAAAIPATPIYINEIYFNPAGTDAPNEYVELRGTPNAVIQMGYYLVGIEGDSSGPGDVQDIFDLSGLSFGSNGLLVILQKGNTYTTAAGANVYTNAGTGAGFGSGTGSSVGHSADASATDIENSSATFVLVSAPAAPSLTDDVDSDNNGTPDGSVFTGWTVLDSVGITDAAADFGYGAINYDSSGAAVTTGTRVTTSFIAGYVGRIGNSTGSTAADWVASVTTGTAPNFSLSNAAGTTPGSMANLPLNHIGAVNSVAPASAGVTVTPTSGLNTTEAGGTATFTIVLTTQPTANVTIPLSSSDATEGTVSPASVTFTTANWSVAQTVTVTGVDDALVDGTVAYTVVTGAATSTDLAYNGFNASDVAVSNSDNEAAGVTVTPTSGLTTTEAGGTATFTIVLDMQPTGSVTIPLTSSDLTEGTVSPTSITFTTVNWNVPQTVTVTGVDDVLVDGNIAYTVVTGAATSTDLTYNGFNPADVAVSNTDNDVATPAGVIVTPTSGLVTTEAGTSATFTIVLATQPTGTVTIPLSSSDATEGNVSPTSVTFTTATWNIPQTVTVTGVDDAIVDGTIFYTVVTGPATSTDLAYSGFNAADVSVSNTDNDVVATAGVTVTPTSGLVTTEAGGTATFTIVLNTQPTATVTIPLSSSDATEGSVAPTSVTFTTVNWNIPQTVTITGLDDALVDGTVAYTIVTGPTTSTDLAYSGFDPADVAVSNTDNDVAGPGSFTVSPTTGLTTTESGGVAVFTIVLNTQPTANVTIPLSSSDTTEGTVSPSSITFTSANWNVPQIVTVTGVDDALVDGTIAYTIITGAATSTDTNYSGVNAADVSLNNIDNEVAAPAGVTVTPTTGLTTTEAGGTATFTIVLNSQPTGTVTIPLSSSDATEGSVSPSSVTFTPANWNVPQTVTVTGLDDAIVDGPITYTVVTGPATSTDLAYNGFNAGDVSVTNTDNDVAGPGSFTVSPTTGLTTTESGGIAVFTIVLNTQPTANVTIPLTSSDTTEGTVSPSSITFTSANWNIPQLVTVTGVDDALVDGTIAYTIITGAATSTDTNYSGVNAADVALNNIDNEVAAPAGVTVTPTTGLTTTEAGGTATFTIVLNSQPTGSVTIPLSSSDATEGSVSPTSVTFTTVNWNIPQTVTVTGIDDAIVDGPITYTVVTGPATSTDLAYNGFNAGDVSVTNTDNDVAGPGSFTVSPTSGLTTTESGGVAVFTIVLNTQPTANVTIPISSSDTTEGTVSPSSITFTSANWNVPQLVTVTGVDDAIVDGTVAYTILTGAATSTDTNYSGVNPADVAVSNTDNDVAAPAGVTVTPTSGLTTTEAGGTATFTIVLNSQPTSTVTIPLTSGDATEGNVSPSSVTFTPANWNVAQTVTVTGVDDAIVDGPITYTVVTGSATSTDLAYSGFNAADVSVTNTDNDVAGPGSITVSPTSGLTTTESGGVAVFTIVLNTQPTANVTIPISSSDTTEGTVSPSSITFTSTNWNVPQLVTVTGVDDAIVDGTIAYTIVTGAATSTDTNYSGVNAADVALSNVDNEVAAPGGITVTPTSGLTTTEAGGTATFTIVLNSQPTASVTVPLTSSDLTEGTVSPSSITFTTANWNVPQTVTVTGVDDVIVDGNVAFTILTGAATSTDANYNGANAADVTVTNTDNDTGGNTAPTISDIGNQTANEDTQVSNVPFTVNDAETAAGSLTVTGTSSNTTLFPAGSITFSGTGSNRTISLNPAANQSGTSTITVTVDDGAGGQTSDTFTVTVNSVNDAPTLNPISNPASVPQNSGLQTINLSGISAGGGETQNLTVTATSSNPALISNPTVTYTSANLNGTLSYTPTPNQSGTSTITVTVTDDGGTANGGVNTTTQTFTVTVAGATNPLPTTPGTVQVVDDPENPGRGVLVINGTSGLDVITVVRFGSDRTLVLVPLSGIFQTFDNSTFDRILINGYAGSDRIILDPFLNKPATIYGDAGDDIILSGAGNDLIYGGTGTDFIYGRGGNDVIFGEDGRDYLYGDDGNDVVVGGNDDDTVWGGSGADVLNGGSGLDYLWGFGGDDLIIGGNLTQANSLQGLRSIQAKWSANLPFDARISSLAPEINSTTVTNDSRADWIYGNDGRDWIVDYALLDMIWDFNGNSSNGDRRN